MDPKNYSVMLESILAAIVDYPEEVSVTKGVDEMGVLMTVKVNQVDMGKVIGVKGATAKAIRTLLRAAGKKESAIVSLKILEPDGTEKRSGE